MSTQEMPQLIAEYFKTQPVLKAWLFGSFSRRGARRKRYGERNREME